MKQCSKCLITKPITDFYKNKRASDGINNKCKHCAKADHKAWRNANSEKVKATNDAWRKANPEKAKKSSNNWRIANLEKSRLTTNIWQKNNIEKARTAVSNWSKANSEKRNNSENLRRARKLNNGVYIVSEKFLTKLYSSACLYCGNTENIAADHIIPILRGGTHSEGNLQPLCKTCNSSKGAKTMTEWIKGK